MRNAIFTILTCLFLCGSLTATGHAKLYFSLYGTGGVHDFATEQNLDADALSGLKVSLDFEGGKEAHDFSLEGTFNQFSATNLDDDSPVDATVTRLDVIYPLMQKTKWRPFLTVGIGRLMFDGDDNRPDDEDIVAYGAGLKYLLTEYLTLRTEGRHELIFNRENGNIDNYEYTASLGYTFGKRKPSKKKPKPEPKPKSEPKPEPKKPSDDDDQDGVKNPVDRCPGTPAGIKVDSTGCAEQTPDHSETFKEEAIPLDESPAPDEKPVIAVEPEKVPSANAPTPRQEKIVQMKPKAVVLQEEAPAKYVLPKLPTVIAIPDLPNQEPAAPAGITQPVEQPAQPVKPSSSVTTTLKAIAAIPALPVAAIVAAADALIDSGDAPEETPQQLTENSREHAEFSSAADVPAVSGTETASSVSNTGTANSPVIEPIKENMPQPVDNPLLATAQSSKPIDTQKSLAEPARIQAHPPVVLSESKTVEEQSVRFSPEADRGVSTDPQSVEIVPATETRISATTTAPRATTASASSPSNSSQSVSSSGTSGVTTTLKSIAAIPVLPVAAIVAAADALIDSGDALEETPQQLTENSIGHAELSSATEIPAVSGTETASSVSNTGTANSAVNVALKKEMPQPMDNPLLATAQSSKPIDTQKSLAEPARIQAHPPVVLSESKTVEEQSVKSLPEAERGVSTDPQAVEIVPATETNRISATSTAPPATTASASAPSNSSQSVSSSGTSVVMTTLKSIAVPPPVVPVIAVPTLADVQTDHGDNSSPSGNDIGEDVVYAENAPLPATPEPDSGARAVKKEIRSGAAEKLTTVATLEPATPGTTSAQVEHVTSNLKAERSAAGVSSTASSLEADGPQLKNASSTQAVTTLTIPECSGLPPHAILMLGKSGSDLYLAANDDDTRVNPQPYQTGQNMAQKSHVSGASFPFNEWTLSQQAKRILDLLIKQLEGSGLNYKIRVEGHTDSVGSEAYNYNLSLLRANAVATFLENEKDVAPSKLAIAGCGEWKPLASNETDEGRALNRRFELVILPVEEQ